MNSFEKLISRYGSFPRNYYSHLISWPHWDLLHIHSGELSILYKGRSIEVQQGQTALIPPGTEFRIQNNTTITTASVQYFIPFQNSEIQNLLKRFHSPYLHKESNENPIENHILELMRIYNQHTPISRIQELLLELIIEKIFSDRTRGNKSNHPWGDLINKYISMLEQSPSIEEVAQWAGYSPSRFRVLFQKETGMQPLRFFLNLRMEKAAEKLIETVIPIKEISRKHGYNEVTHFNRAFSRHFGISPGRYRRKNTFWG